MKIVMKTIRIMVYATTCLTVLFCLESSIKVCLYIAAGLFFIILFGGLFLPESSRIRRHIFIIGGIYYALFFSYIAFGTIYVKHVDSHVEIYSPLRLYKLQEGERIDTISLRPSVNLTYTTYQENYSDYYFLYKSDTLFIYNQHRLVMQKTAGFDIIQRQYYGVSVDLFQDEKGNVFSFYDGAPVDSQWKVHVHDVTPIEPSI